MTRKQTVGWLLLALVTLVFVTAMAVSIGWQITLTCVAFWTATAVGLWLVLAD